MRQVHTEVVTTFDDNDTIIDIQVNTEDSATWHESHTYDTDKHEWVEDSTDQLMMADINLTRTFQSAR